MGAGRSRQRPGCRLELTTQLAEIALGLTQIAQDALALGAGECRRDRGQARRGVLRQAGDLRKVTGQRFRRAHRRRRFALRVEAFEKEQRIGKKPHPDLAPSRLPSGPQSADLAAGETVLGGHARQTKPRLPIAAHQRNQILHRRTRRNLPAAQESLDLLRELVDQGQTARDPTRCAAQTPCQIGRAQTEATQLGQQPALLQRGLRRGRA